MKSAPRILVVEDERALALAVAAAARKIGADVEVVPTAALAKKELEGGPFSAMVLDIGLPDQNGLDFLAGLSEPLRPPTLVITAHGEIGNTITARKIGVGEFLTKPLDFAEFAAALRRTLPASPKPRSAGSAAGGDAGSADAEALFIGATPAMRPVFRQIAHACATSDPVLISGETGTGKTRVAHLIQRNADHAGEGFAEFRPGGGDQVPALAEAIGQGRGGVVVMENIARLSPDAQAELVRLWDEGAAGGFPRVLATSSTDLRAAVASGEFLSPLYYRLQVLGITLPPLQDRIDDLPAIFDFFLGGLAPDRAVTVTRDAMAALLDHPWPGNLRELRNVASYALTVAAAGEISPAHLPEHLVSATGAPPGDGPSPFERDLDSWVESRLAEAPGTSYRDLADDLEAKLIRNLLARHDGKLARLASAMDANRTTLRNKLRKSRDPSED